MNTTRACAHRSAVPVEMRSLQQDMNAVFWLPGITQWNKTPTLALYSIHLKIIQGQRTEYNLPERELEGKVLQKQERLGFDPGLRPLPLAHPESVKIGGRM